MTGKLCCNLVTFVLGLVLFHTINVTCVKTAVKNQNQRSSLSDLLSWIPPAADVLQMNGSHPDCVQQAQQLLQRADQLDLKALQMLDSWAKLPPGVLSGNINQLGDFDECLRAGGRYCLATMDLRLPAWLSSIDTRLHAHYAMTGFLDDPGHRIPKFSLVHWATCLPLACSPQDLQVSLSHALTASSGHTGVTAMVKVDPDLCHAEPPSQWSIPTLIAWCFFISVFLLCVLGDVNEMSMNAPLGSVMGRVTSAFSARRNLHSLTQTGAGQGEVRCLHGVRALNALALLLSHKQMALLFLPIVNRTQFAEWVGRAWSMSGRSATLYTDSFILVSGLLTARSLLRQLSASGKMDVRDYVLSRFIRLLPSLAALILFSTLVLPGLASGPLWNLLVTKYSTLCHSYWWRNLLFIHNHFPFDQMCLTHSHQVSIDMQLSLAAPLLLYPLWRWPRTGVALLLVISIWSSLLRYSATITHHLSTVIYYGISISQLYRTAELTYILPSHRATVYCLGIALGTFLHQYNSCTLTYRQTAVGWLLGVVCGLFSIFGPYHMSWPGYIYRVEEAALYNALAPVLWSLFVGWVIFATHYGFGGWFGQFLEWKWFAVFTKISYAVYLTQFPIFFLNVGQNRTTHQYSFFKLVDLPEFAMVLLVSVALTLMFDMPAQNLKKAFLPLKGSKKDETHEAVTENGREFVNKENLEAEEVTVRNRLPG